ncbi:TPA: sigma-70 family RNA polymerase sigma factor [Streptococcus suis]|nr:sigma-70 family RNA polymerase sigma factor [Streptococcus suis]HEM6356412.1 sigma-70 family RNA polymerase sigma factor [Streptococcus suis]HEM6380546.1 sigma-70 family RNA polymerase sigma factor [Streptococcus suis]HEM6409766.1 sigma-70 family RNA polymerase sigma factor [Streptococcus suis]
MQTENLGKKQFYIPMEVNTAEDKAFIYANGYTPDDVVWWRIGNIAKRAVLIPCTEEQYRAYMRPIWSEMKQEERKKKHFEELGMTQVSVEHIKEEYDLEIADTASLEQAVMKQELLAELKVELAKLTKLDQKIMELFQEGYSESAIGKAIGMSQKGVNKRKNKVINNLKLHFLEK